MTKPKKIPKGKIMPLNELASVAIDIGGFGITSQIKENGELGRIVISFLSIPLPESGDSYIITNISMTPDEAENFANKILEVIKTTEKKQEN